ncbi:hypothetical protein GCM10028814_34620 [Angustibacter aerolatus]
MQAVLAAGLVLALALPWVGLDDQHRQVSGWGLLLQREQADGRADLLTLVGPPALVLVAALLAVLVVYRPGARLLLASRVVAGVALLAAAIMLVQLLASDRSVRAGLGTAMLLLLGWLAPPSAVTDD